MGYALAFRRGHLKPDEEEQLQLIRRAKMGDLEAMEKMAKRDAYIYLEEEIEGLNFFLSKYHHLDPTLRVHHEATIWLRRSACYEEPATVLWLQPLEGKYYILRCQFDDGHITDWLTSIVGPKIRPLVDLTSFGHGLTQ